MTGLASSSGVPNINRYCYFSVSKIVFSFPAISSQEVSFSVSTSAKNTQNVKAFHSQVHAEWHKTAGSALAFYFAQGNKHCLYSSAETSSQQ